MATTQQRYITPRVNIFEMDDAITIEADLPGVSKDDTEIELRDGRLIVKANRRANGTHGAYRIQERPTAAYYREFALGEAVDPSKVDAHLNDGVLKITLGKVDRLKPRSISVN